MKYRLETFFVLSTWRRAAEAFIDYFFLYLLLIYTFFSPLRRKTNAQWEASAFERVDSQLLARRCSSSCDLILQYLRGKIGKIKNWQFDGSIIILICSGWRLETEWEKRSAETIILYKEYSWINMHILRERARRVSRARSDAPSATSRGELASIARWCSSTRRELLRY